jgi:nitrite reductase/ring-hydroxylating ferredoxin subunit
VQDVPEGRGLCVRIEGVDVGLFRVDGEIRAMENRCPHAGDPLSEGLLEGPIVTCRAHGWRFDVRTGFRPSDADGYPIPCFPARIVEGFVEVDLETALN